MGIYPMFMDPKIKYCQDDNTSQFLIYRFKANSYFSFFAENYKLCLKDMWKIKPEICNNQKSVILHKNRHSDQCKGNNPNINSQIYN